MLDKCTKSYRIMDCLLIGEEFIIDSKGTGREGFRATTNFSTEHESVAISENCGLLACELSSVEICSVHRTYVLNGDSLIFVSLGDS